LGNVFVGSPSARARQPILSANWNFYLCPATAGLAKSGLFEFLLIKFILFGKVIVVKLISLSILV